MDLKEFIESFAEQFDDTDISEFDPTTVYQDLDEWGSLTALGIIAFVRTKYNKKITALDIRSCSTIEELFNLVEQR